MRTPERIRIVPRLASAVLGGALLLSLAVPAAAQSLRGSPASLDRQNIQARAHDFSYIDTPSRVRYFAEQGWLERVRPNRDFRLHAVSFPYARPEAHLFVRRLAAQYRAACGEQMVVTSLTRPTTRQPRNASSRSVHPTGMAIDLRYSRNRACRSWLEGVLLSLERAGVLEATRERYPPHYHVALFPDPYERYVQKLASGPAAPSLSTGSATASRVASYRVRQGDSLWTIARRAGTTVEALKSANNLRGSRIYAGQVLEVPSTR